VPRMPHERFHGKSRTGFRGDAIVQLDWTVGEIVRILKEQGLEKNTMIVFCSDNGSVLDDGYKDGAVEKLHDHKPAGPYAGGKYKIQEGGTRTPFITYWPGTIKPGVSEKIVCTIDLANSLATHLGVEIPEGACLDSLNVMPALLGKEDAKGRSNLIQQSNGREGVNSSMGYRSGKWKLQRSVKKSPKKAKANKAGANKAGAAFSYTLYDLENDIAEKKNVAKQNPEVFARLKTELQKQIDDGRSRH
jgi:arylsulfatase A-like enzyme